ncbi:MAG: hypothetical protein QNK37_29740, partial [Acidobacteriota bacterium]|nr:hypothetical protein [Acidobacteriota bacterium]
MHLSPLKPLLLLLLSGAFLHAQNPKVYEDYNALLAQKQTVATQPSVYVNKKYGYQMAVPPWLDLQNTGDERVAGGLLPRVSGIQNAVAVKASDKREFPDFNAYIDFVYGANEAGKPMKMSPNMTWEGGQEVSGAAHPTYEVFIKARNLIYHCRFVLMETPKAYLLIDLWATESTYFQNLDRFKEFL